MEAKKSDSKHCTGLSVLILMKSQHMKILTENILVRVKSKAQHRCKFDFVINPF